MRGFVTVYWKIFFRSSYTVQEIKIEFSFILVLKSTYFIYNILSLNAKPFYCLNKLLLKKLSINIDKHIAFDFLRTNLDKTLHIWLAMGLV